MLLFVSIWNREDTKATKKIKTERPNKTQNEDEVHLYLIPHPLGGHSSIQKWHARITANSFFMLRSS